MNLHLYIPPHSAHPPGVTLGTIIGMIKTYWETNTDPKDFIFHASQLYARFVKRGYPHTVLNTHFTTACNRLKTTNNTNDTRVPDYRRQLFFHLLYHPKGIDRKDIRRAYEQTIPKVIENRKLTIAISRPRNLQDKLCRSKLLITKNNNNPSDYIFARTKQHSL